MQRGREAFQRQRQRRGFKHYTDPSDNAEIIAAAKVEVQKLPTGYALGVVRAMPKA
jgi:hypothetical protein